MEGWLHKNVNVFNYSSLLLKACSGLILLRALNSYSVLCMFSATYVLSIYYSPKVKD